MGGPSPGGRVGRRTAATGVSAPAGGRSHGGAPPILFLVLPKKRMRRARWKRKMRFCALRHLRASALLRGAAYRCKRRFGLAFGHAWVFCEFAAAVPCRMMPTASGCKDAFELLLFPRVPLRYALPGQSWGLMPSVVEDDLPALGAAVGGSRWAEKITVCDDFLLQP